jgi:hypothetical protein
MGLPNEEADKSGVLMFFGPPKTLEGLLGLLFDQDDFASSLTGLGDVDEANLGGLALPKARLVGVLSLSRAAMTVVRDVPAEDAVGNPFLLEESSSEPDAEPDSPLEVALGLELNAKPFPLFTFGRPDTLPRSTVALLACEPGAAGNGLLFTGDPDDDDGGPMGPEEDDDPTIPSACCFCACIAWICWICLCTKLGGGMDDADMGWPSVGWGLGSRLNME